MQEKTSQLIGPLLRHVIDPKSPVILHDRDGRIHEIFNNPMPYPVRGIADKGNLEPFFDLSPLKRDVPGTQMLLGRKTPLYHFYFEDVYSSFPLHYLLTRELENGLFMGRVGIMDIMPPLQLNYGLGFFFTDMKGDTLECFEKTIVPFFLDRPEKPESLLGRPLSQFVSPTPAEFQKAHLARFSLSEQEQFRRVHPPASGAETEKERIVESASAGSVYLEFPFAVDLSAQDFIFSVSYRPLRGLCPYVTLGPEREKDEEPDADGYMAGRSFGDQFFVLKRRGFVVTRREKPFNTGEAETLSFCKINKSLFLYRGQDRALEFFDEDFITHGRARIHFVVRRDSACVLTSSALLTRPSTPSGMTGSPGQHIAALVQRKGHYCLLSRFHNNAIMVPNWLQPDLAGYHPVNITSFQSVIQDLEKSRRRFEKRTLVLDTLLKNYQAGGEEFIGASDGIRRIKGIARTVAASDATVLIEGPTGSGKEVLAEYIHHHSPRRDGRFIKVDCATVPRELIESHLFGHEKGAFTGAAARRVGMFEQAHGGTLFLDEVGNLPLDLQAKLLSFFNDFTITRVGGEKTLRVDVRCVLASNLNLRERVAAGVFREDLYYRINVITLSLPPLRDRAGDLAELSHYFLLRFNALHNRQVREISPEALEKLAGHAWPGNVRELKNVIQQAVIFAPGETLTPDLIRFKDAGKPPGRGGPSGAGPRFSLKHTDPAVVAGLLEKHLGRPGEVAAEMGVSRTGLYLYLKRHRISAAGYKKGFQQP